MNALLQSPAWQALQKHVGSVGSTPIITMFEQDADRAERFTISAAHWLLDYSKNRISNDTMSLLLALAEQVDVASWRDRLFAGDTINHTEKRAALHVALRDFSGRKIEVDGQDVMPVVQAMQAKVRAFSDSVRNGDWCGYSGKRITDVVNIGIGGSDLGPKMVCEALQPYTQTHLNVHFVSNLDGIHIEQTLRSCQAETTLFIISSKSFSTQETLSNALAARAWYLDQGGPEQKIDHHFVAVTSNNEKATEFGIAAEMQFSMWDWVGGRYSLWSAIGLPIAISVGMDNFEALLQGAHAMDKHFQTAPLAENMSVILALLGVWNSNFLGLPTHAVLPYSQQLESLQDYLQQADMESNGKSVDRDGQFVDYTTGPVIWGGTGTNAQHAFLQLIQQGTQAIPTDFILFKHSQSSLPEQHLMLLANGLAQMEAIMRGKPTEQAAKELRAQGVDEAESERLAPYMTFAGNVPSNALLADELTPQALGALIALYEHKIFVQGVIWNINSFDQYGVEYGKKTATAVLHALQGSAPDSTKISSSTAALIKHLS